MFGCIYIPTHQRTLTKVQHYGASRFTAWSNSDKKKSRRGSWPIVVIVFRRVTSAHNKPRLFFLLARFVRRSPAGKHNAFPSEANPIRDFVVAERARTAGLSRFSLLPIVAVPRSREIGLQWMRYIHEGEISVAFARVKGTRGLPEVVSDSNPEIRFEGRIYSSFFVNTVLKSLGGPTWTSRDVHE